MCRNGQCNGKIFPQGKVKWVVPEGGIFLWCECPTIEDITPIVDKCLERKSLSYPVQILQRIYMLRQICSDLTIHQLLLKI